MSSTVLVATSDASARELLTQAVTLSRVSVVHAADGIEALAIARRQELDLAILDNPFNPYRFESFLNVAQEDQARVLARLANQDRLYLAFYGDSLTHRFTKIVEHDEQQWQYLDELVSEAIDYWDQIPPEQRDFDRAKAEFMRRFA